MHDVIMNDFRVTCQGSSFIITDGALRSHLPAMSNLLGKYCVSMAAHVLHLLIKHLSKEDNVVSDGYEEAVSIRGQSVKDSSTLR